VYIPNTKFNRKSLVVSGKQHTDFPVRVQFLHLLSNLVSTSRSWLRASSMITSNKNQPDALSFKIIKFYFTLRCSTCFGHHCVYHQELPTIAHAASGHRVVLCQLLPPALFCCYCCFRFRESSSNNRTGLEDATGITPHGDQRLHMQ
jgi:hypothetical protein